MDRGNRAISRWVDDPGAVRGGVVWSGGRDIGDVGGRGVGVDSEKPLVPEGGHEHAGWE